MFNASFAKILLTVMSGGLFASSAEVMTAPEGAFIKEARLATIRFVPEGKGLRLELVGLKIEKAKKSDLGIQAFSEEKERDQRLIVRKSEKGEYTIDPIPRPAKIRFQIQTRSESESFQVQFD